MTDTTLMISSIRNHPPDRDLVSLGGIDQIYIEDWKPTDHRRVYFRALYETELNSTVLSEVAKIFQYYNNNNAIIINNPTSSLYWHRKDIWYLQEKNRSAVPEATPNPTLNECLFTVKDYPVILRQADSSGGAHTYLCHNEIELKKTHTRLQHEADRTLLVEYIEDRIENFFGLLQAWVVDGAIFCHHRAVHGDWKWDRSQPVTEKMKAAYEHENSNFTLNSELTKLILHPSNVSSTSIYSIEILLGKEGARIIDVNPMAYHLFENENRAPFKKGLMKRIHEFVTGESNNPLGKCP